ncbi:MAG: hypothetical protein P4M11_00700 [Candidatus Pacebacteria bacterium]|nr:hypothetical protein [Candidatus Paceibacterota bacterium]
MNKFLRFLQFVPAALLLAVVVFVVAFSGHTHPVYAQTSSYSYQIVTPPCTAQYGSLASGGFSYPSYPFTENTDFQFCSAFDYYYPTGTSPVSSYTYSATDAAHYPCGGTLTSGSTCSPPVDQYASVGDCNGAAQYLGLSTSNTYTCIVKDTSVSTQVGEGPAGNCTGGSITSSGYCPITQETETWAVSFYTAAPSTIYDVPEFSPTGDGYNLFYRSPPTYSGQTLICGGAAPGGTTTELGQTLISTPMTCTEYKQTPTVPTVTLTASPASVTSGSASALTWASTNATSCSINNSVGSVTPVAGGSKSVSPTSTTTYTITCTGTGGTATASATVTVSASTTPTASLTASPASITTGSSSTLSWACTNSTSSTGSGFSTGSATSGSVSVSPTSTTSYTVTCTGTGGTANHSATVTVTAPVKPTVSLTANPTSISSGKNSQLSWTSSNATSCSIDQGVGTVTPVNRGNTNVSPSSTTTYTLTCTGSGGSATDTATVSITGADLTAGSISPTTASVGVATTLSSTVSNTGTVASASFPNIFEINDSSTVVQTSNTAALSAGNSSPISASYTFPSAGTYQVRACANTNSSWTNVATESNYGNNCGAWQTVTVYALTASCSVSPTTAYVNQSVTWTATASNGSGGYSYVWGGSVSGTSATEQTTYASAGSYSGQVQVTSNGQTVTAICSPGGTSNPVTIQSCTPTLTANPSTISTGQTSTLTWSEPSACATSCVFSDGHSAGLSGNYTVTPPTPSSGNTDTYAVTCGAPANTAQTTITVNSPSATIVAAPNRVPVGGSTTVTWSSTNTNTCSVTRNGQAWALGTGTSGTATDTISTQTVYALTCDTTSAATTAVVNVVPSFQEF